MNDLAAKIIREALGRTATAEDYRRIDEMLRTLPSEITSSPGAMFDIVLRTDYLRQLEETIAKAGREAQQRIHHDLPERTEQAALKALVKIRDSLPMDAAHSAKRMFQAAIIGALIFSTVAGASGWVLGANAAKKAQETTHASSDRELGRCVDAASGAFANSYRAGVRSTPISYDAIRNDLMICGAEYADRRAEAG